MKFTRVIKGSLFIRSLILVAFLLPAVSVYAQDDTIELNELALTNFSNLDSLERSLATASGEKHRAIALSLLANAYSFREADKGLKYGREGLAISQKLNYETGIAFNLLSIASAYWSLGSYDNALRSAFEALRRFEKLDNKSRIVHCYVQLSIINRDVGDYSAALLHSHTSLQLSLESGYSPRISYANLGSIHDLLNQPDSAAYYTKMAHELDMKDNKGEWDWIYWIQGNIEAKKQNYPRALDHYRKALSLALKTNIFKTIVEAHNGISQVYLKTGQLDSAILYANEVLAKWQYVSYQKGVLEAARLLANAYKGKNEPDSAIKYFEYSAALNDQLFNQQQARNMQAVGFAEQLRQDEIDRERQDFRHRLNIYILIGLGLFLLVIALVLWRNNLQRKRSYHTLQQQKAETDFQKDKAEAALVELQAAQKQLIQSEKMASLGELTAGIAHEIQNPLNFVNNFSEVNRELISELVDEVDKGNTAEVKAIATDIKENSDKINQHGKRADAIVKNMLQHSRSSSGKKEATDINALADEYLRLAYHGMRAKDKSFNARIETNFDASAGKTLVVPQDIGRALLNLFNNAFYAVAEKAKQTAPGYEAVVKVSSKQSNGKIEIRVADNGNGISPHIADKIFQPFFTTKPTGQGTGLGLSLAYDIVKAHGGELKVETKAGIGTDLIIDLPVSKS